MGAKHELRNINGDIREQELRRIFAPRRGEMTRLEKIT
jgi:hypothetical protein